MKIIAYIKDKIIEFELPKEVSGSFSFDENPEEISKLINVESRNGQWYIYSTDNSKLFQNNQPVPELILQENNFYVIKRYEDSYLLYSSTSYDKNIMPYKYETELNVVVGNTETCNIIYNCEMVNCEAFSISIRDNTIVLSLLNNIAVYVNKKLVIEKETIINIGDEIHLFGLNIIILCNMILINNPNEKVLIKEESAKIKYCILENSDEHINDEVKERELYDEDDFFSKSPILRRFIETKKIKLEQPPSSGNDNEMPLIMVIAPMLTMGITSGVTLLNTIIKLNNGETTIKQSWPQLVTGIAMLASTLLWPFITRMYTKYQRQQRKEKIEKKYKEYLMKKNQELAEEKKLQADILLENLISLSQCVEQIKNRGILFWNKRIDQSDFLTVRIGTGNQKLDVDIDYQEKEFSIDENELKELADILSKKYEYIENVPIGYSLYENKITAVMGERKKSVAFVNNLILQLLTFYSYEDLKIVVFTTKEKSNEWDYIKYLYHAFSNDKQIRFYSTTEDNTKMLSEYFEYEVMNRKNQNSKEDTPPKPYYLIITDNYEDIKKYNFIKEINESEEELGFSMVILENKLSKLPSKCYNFISLMGNRFVLLMNSPEKQEQVNFSDEIDYRINMMEVARIESNIPIEFEEGVSQLTDSISFLEIEKVGKVEQLNILNRWNTNNPITSLRAEVGVNEQGDLIYLDLHEKYHGPHGLIAGTTGSGKSEFIITYILSMAINYSPEYVSFILIDYKGGGLAGAFENKTTGMSLPHLAGTITNLDKAEMDRTLVSIESEAKRRQMIFNETRDALGESTIDIYKYQQFYKDGKVTEPIPHLFIICDEFAELKAQQPEFMDNLISIARIGRSLGVHLILATQKPSGVVNAQIWSNTKFRVCLKVQDEADSKEMLKKADAAHIKQAGRFFLQVGMDELYILGQSAYCGAKYYPSNQIVKQIDKSINFINDCGNIIKSIQAANNSTKRVQQGEQISAIMKEIITIAQKGNNKAKKLWLENIPAIILVDDLIAKYQIETKPYNIEAIIGEYDAPESQEQGLVKYNFLEDGNTIIYGLDSEDKEMLLKTIIYSTIIKHNASEINYYIIDYGSETLRIFEKLPQVGGIVYASEEEKFNNLFKMLSDEIKRRKQLFSKFGGEYSTYIKAGNNDLPIISIIINNYPSIKDAHDDFTFNILPSITRDSERYGIIFILTTTSLNSISTKNSQNFNNIYAFKLKEQMDYRMLFVSKKKITPRDMIGRGIYKSDDIHEFQTASILNNQEKLNEFISNVIANEKSKSTITAKRIPTLPNIVRFDDILSKISTIEAVPVGISKDELEIVFYNFTNYLGTLICSNKIINTNNFVLSLCQTLKSIKENNIVFIDALNKIQEVKGIIKNYYNNSYKEVIKMLKEYYQQNNSNINNQMLIIYGLDKFINLIENKKEFEDLIEEFKKNEKCRLIIIEDQNKIKAYAYDNWYKYCFSSSDGIWIGKGITDQTIFKTGIFKKEYTLIQTNNFGFILTDGNITLTKLIDFVSEEEKDQ